MDVGLGIGGIWIISPIRYMETGAIDRAQSFRKGWGVTMDDVLAGLLTGVILGGVYFGLQ